MRFNLFHCVYISFTNYINRGSFVKPLIFLNRYAHPYAYIKINNQTNLLNINSLAVKSDEIRILFEVFLKLDNTSALIMIIQ